MTQEAKQAAQEHAYNPYSYSGEMFCEGYDAARVPLVALCDRWLERAATITPNNQRNLMAQVVWETAEKELRAALTGTGEK